MAPYHIRIYQESDQKPVVDLFSGGMAEHVPATFRYMLKLPGILLLEFGVPLSLLLLSGSWLLAAVSSLTLLFFLWFLARYTWQQYQVTYLRTDLADITKTYLSTSDSCFWVAESGGQVVGIVSALPEENPPPGKKQLRLLHLSVAMEHRGVGMAKALVRTVLQFARSQGYGEVVLDTSMLQHSALALYQGVGFQKTGYYYANNIWKLTRISVFQFIYHLPCAQDGGL